MCENKRILHPSPYFIRRSWLPICKLNAGGKITLQNLIWWAFDVWWKGLRQRGYSVSSVGLCCSATNRQPLTFDRFWIPVHVSCASEVFSGQVQDIRPIYIGKNQNPKTCFFCCTVYTARKTHNIRGFWHEKTWISYLCFGKWCACATSL